MPQLGCDNEEPKVLHILLLGFDQQGGRIGHGGCLFDHYLAHRPNTMRIGIAWISQEVEEVPRDPWDAALTAVVTDLETINVRPPSL
ncbi:5-formyltetrahydrofolate cyclo-ligase [Sphingobium sp. HWE2-09]|uniref:5-formyltetrahydrofolate cyclo-ligase n=1 Tax=Sphingobium sp. HWE2-09 TaxID=3108390 RepID=UPI002DD2F413|nr:5-formyltetrahydrofolate cyclo-ligase [Sphingobium sp. HWE2-09]